jgi:methionine-rich copper-binding protein CopC
MAKKPTVSTITSGYASNTQLNANFEALRDSFDNTLSLDGSTPNSMGADLNLNSNDILNADGIQANSLTIAGSSFDISALTGLASVSGAFIAPRSSEPTTRDDGTALQAGDIYLNTTSNVPSIYNGSTFIELGTNLTSAEVDVFSANGSTTAFTLSSAPSSENFTFVYVSGVYQAKSTYSVSSTTLTFSSAPPPGTNNIEVVNFDGSLLETSVNKLTSKTELKASSTLSIQNYDGSWWEYDASVTNAVYSVDTTEAILVSPTGSGDGAWVRQFDDGRLNIRWFGAVGDGTTNDAPAIQAAVAMASGTGGNVSYGRTVYIPNTYNGTTEGGRWFKCDTHIAFANLDNIAFVGDGPQLSKLKFEDSYGLKVTSSTTGQNSRLQFKGFTIEGNSDDSSSSAKWAGILLEACSNCVFEDILINRFVDGIVVDADPSGTSGTGSINNKFLRVFVLQADFPNPVNDYPRYGVRFTNTQGTSFKPQLMQFKDCTIYSSILVDTETLTGDGSNLSFVIDDFSGLTQASGIKVFVKDSDGNWEKRTIGTGSTQYKLYDYTSGSRGTEITTAMDAKDAGNPMPNSNGASITKAEVVFVTAPPALSNNVFIVHSDPRGSQAIRIDEGSANSFDVSIGGYLTGVWFDGGASNNLIDENEFTFQYVQLTDTVVDRHASISTFGATTITVNDYAESHVDEYVHPSRPMTDCIIDKHGPTRRISDKLTSDVVLTGSYQDILTWDVPNRRHGTHRHVEASIFITAIETSTTRVSADVKLEYSDDNGANYSTLQIRRLESDVTGATGNTNYLSTYLSTYHNVSVYNPKEQKTLKYRVQAKFVSGDTVTAEGSSIAYQNTGTVTIVNP